MDYCLSHASWRSPAITASSCPRSVWNTLLACLALLACGHAKVPAPIPAASTDAVYPEPDPELLRPFSDRLNAEAPSEPPYAVRYRSGGAELLYVATVHEAMAGGETFSLVERCFREASPQVVIVEGLAASIGPNPRHIIDLIAGVPLEGPWPNGEAFFLARLAADTDVPFIGAKPDDREVLEAFKLEGYTLEDVLGYQLTRQIPQWRREARSEPLSTLVDDFVATYLDGVNREGAAGFTLETLARWYEKRNGSTFDPVAINELETAPVTDAPPLYTRDMALLDIRVRDHAILTQIATELRSHKSVLVAYGFGHHLTQLHALEAMLGPGELVP